MKYLKMFESASIKDLLTQLEEKTGINIIKPEIDELLIDVKDQFPNTTISKDLAINLTYKRKNVRKATISYNYYTEIVEKGGREYVTDINYIRDFLDKCELATSINMEYGVKLHLQFANSEDLDTLKEEVENIESRAESLGYNFYINDSSEMGRAIARTTQLHPRFKNPNKSIDDIINDIRSIFIQVSQLPNWEGGGYATIFLLFECEIDKDNLKSSVDFSKVVPQNIVTDFVGFLDKWRVPNNNKLELVNIIKRGDWSDNTTAE
jgi:hypothetical protein